MRLYSLLPLALLALGFSIPAAANLPDGTRKLVLVAGKPSHPPRMHEFNAGVQLLAKSLASVPGLKTEFVLNGWPADESIFADADAVVFYMDGGGGHEVVKEEGTRLAKVDAWAKKGVGLGFMHYGVEVVAEQAGAEFKRWIGGYYEHMYSCNPIWEPGFESFPQHPITRGVKPFTIKDEWYFNMRFIEGFSAEGAVDKDGIHFTPILVAKPSDAVRNGPYVHPRGPYPHIQAAKGRPEAMMWAIERKKPHDGYPAGARGFGFTGGHFHDNWGNDEFRRVVLNALVWTASADVPEGGVPSSISKADLDANLDPKPPKK
jgi:hypothetical protein